MRSSDPRVRIVFVHRLNYLPCRQQVVTSNTGPILVFPRIQPFGSDDSSSLGKVYSRQATGSVNFEKSSVSRHEILSDFNCGQESCISRKMCSLCLVVISFQFVLFIFALEFFMCRIIIQRYVCFYHTWHERWTRLSSHNGSPPFYRDRIHILHTFLRLPRKD